VAEFKENTGQVTSNDVGRWELRRNGSVKKVITCDMTKNTSSGCRPGSHQP